MTKRESFIRMYHALYNFEVFANKLYESTDGALDLFDFTDIENLETAIIKYMAEDNEQGVDAIYNFLVDKVKPDELTPVDIDYLMTLCQREEEK